MTVSELPCNAEDAAAVAEAIGLLDEVAQLRRAVRAERGAVDFDTREAKVMLGTDGHPTGVSVRERTRATGLIEEAMLLANEAVARMLAQAEVPAPFRTHERPAPDDLKGTLPVLRELGVIDPGEEPALVAGSPFALQDVLRAAAGTSAAPLVTALLLRAQKRAVYLPHNDGHYALGADAYCHFTSPIRRYPDLVVHRALQALLHGRVESREQHAVARQLPQICRTCSDVERAADAAARATQKLKMAELFADHVGEDFSGVVMGCERFGLFVELDDTCAEGLLPVRALGDEYFVYDDARMALVGEESGRMWRVGQRVAVRVVRADAATGQIDFALSGGRR
ncbi:MAG: RNB domain-containing ribonuclease, partial [Olegusella sp.]|nr:RNB domain-containing ribonuclease [Olegusella sp.]